MTAPAQAEPAFLTAARNITRAMVSCTYCGAIPGDNCLEMLPGHVHYSRLERARAQKAQIMTHELFSDAVGYGLDHGSLLDPQSDV